MHQERAFVTGAIPHQIFCLQVLISHSSYPKPNRLSGMIKRNEQIISKEKPKWISNSQNKRGKSARPIFTAPSLLHQFASLSHTGQKKSRFVCMSHVLAKRVCMLCCSSLHCFAPCWRARVQNGHNTIASPLQSGLWLAFPKSSMIFCRELHSSMESAVHQTEDDLGKRTIAVSR